MRLKFEPAAAAAYENIADEATLDKLDTVFDELEKDPGQARLRRHRWSDPPLWGITVPARGQDLLILWATGTVEDETVVIVHYVGPAVAG
jgi:hypothetical protein